MLSPVIAPMVTLLPSTVPEAARTKEKGHGAFARGLSDPHRHGLRPARGIRCRASSRMLRAGPAAPAESDPVPVRAKSSWSRPRVYGLVTAASRAPAAAVARAAGPGTQHERFDRDHVVEHRLPCCGAVTPLDRLEDPEMVLMGARRPAGRVEGFLAALREQVHQRVHDSTDRAIVRGGADGRVKRGILGEAGLARADLASLVVEDPPHLLDFFRCGPARRERGDGGLEDAPGLKELADRLALGRHHEGERADQRVDRHLAHERPLARSDLHEPEALERAQRLPYRGAAHDELLGEAALGRQLVATFEPALRDQLLDLPNDLLVDPGRLDRPELDTRLCRDLSCSLPLRRR